MSVSNPPTSGAERPSPPLSEEKFDQQEFVASLSPAARAVLGRDWSCEKPTRNSMPRLATCRSRTRSI